MENRPTRKSNRLKGFDYSLSGDYFITFCTKERKNYFWKREYKTEKHRDYADYLSSLGQKTYDIIMRTKAVYNGQADIDKLLIMPDHIHLILTIYEKSDSDKKLSVPRLINQMKRQITIESGVKNMWQKSYYDHIVRNDRDYENVWDYIDANPRILTDDLFLRTD